MNLEDITATYISGWRARSPSGFSRDHGFEPPHLNLKGSRYPDGPCMSCIMRNRSRQPSVLMFQSGRNMKNETNGNDESVCVCVSVLRNIGTTGVVFPSQQ